MNRRSFLLHISVAAISLCFLSFQLSAQNAQVLPPSVIVVDWSSDGARIAGGTTDGRLYVWDAITGEELLTFSALTEQLLSLVWSPDGDRLISGGVDGVIRVWNGSDGRLIRELQGDQSRVFALDWSPNGKSLVSLSFAGIDNLRIWNAETYEPVNTLSVGDVFGMDWSPDGTQIAFAHSGGGAYIVDLSRQTPYGRLSIEGEMASIAWNSDGSLLAIGQFYGGAVTIWDVASDTQVARLEGHTGEVSALLWTANDTQLISIGLDETIRVWDTVSGTLIDTFDTGDVYLRRIDLSPYGGQLAYGGPLPGAEIAPFVVEPGQRTLSHGLVRIVVPAPSEDKLKGLIEQCGAAPEVAQALDAGKFEAVQQATTRPPGCAADLVAVAEALHASE